MLLKNCTNLKTVDIGSVYAIYDSCFYGDTKLEEVICRTDDVPELYGDIIDDSISRHFIFRVPNSVIDNYKMINGDWAKYSGRIFGIEPSVSLQYSNYWLNPSYKTVSGFGLEKHAIIPEMHEGITVVAIGNNGTISTNIESLYLSDKIKNLYPGVFENCMSLENVYIHKKCTNANYPQ